MATKIFHHTEPSPTFAWPGRYPIAYEQSGCVLCPECATETRHKQADPEHAPYMTRDERPES